VGIGEEQREEREYLKIRGKIGNRCDAEGRYEIA
jgi:hypothetical protein